MLHNHWSLLFRMMQLCLLTSVTFAAKIIFFKIRIKTNLFKIVLHNTLTLLIFRDRFYWEKYSNSEQMLNNFFFFLFAFLAP